MNKLIIFKFIPALFMLVMIFSFSAATSEESSKTSESIAEKIVHFIKLDIDDAALSAINDMVRKAAHFTEYLVLSAACFYALSSWKIRPLWLYGGLALFCILYAVSDEIHQYFVPGRSCQLQDIIIDSSGAVTGLLFCWLIVNRKRFFNGNKEKINFTK